jgi:hypothetical protein
MAVTGKNITEEKSPFEDILTKFLNKRMEKVGEVIDSHAMEAMQQEPTAGPHIVSELIKQYSPDQESQSKLSIGPNQGMGKVSYNNQTGAVKMQNPNTIMQFLVGNAPLNKQLQNVRIAQQISQGGVGGAENLSPEEYAARISAFQDAAAEAGLNPEAIKMGAKNQPMYSPSMGQDMAPPIAEAVKRGDFTGYVKADQRTRSAIAAELSKEGVDTSKIDAQLSYLKDVYSGKTAQNTLSLNTLTSHLGYLDEAITQLRAGGQPIENSIVLTARKITGDPSITDFETAKEVVDNELQRALSGIGVTQEGMQRQGLILKGKTFGEKQARQYVSSLSNILNERLNNIERGYKGRIGKDAPEGVIQTSETKTTLSKLTGRGLNRSGESSGGQSGGKTITLPSGRTLDKNTAMQLLQQAGGDKNKARELAKQAGYTF